MKLFAKGKGGSGAPEAASPSFQPIDRTRLLSLLDQVVNSSQSGVLELHEPRGTWVYAFQTGSLTHASGGRVRGARQAFDLLWEFQAGEGIFTPGPAQGLSSNLYIDKGRLQELLRRSQASLQSAASPYIPPDQQRPVPLAPQPWAPGANGMPPWVNQPVPGYPQAAQPQSPPTAYPQQPGYPQQPNFPPRQGFPQQPGYAQQPGYPQQPYPQQPGYAQQPPPPPPGYPAQGPYPGFPAGQGHPQPTPGYPQPAPAAPYPPPGFAGQPPAPSPTFRPAIVPPPAPPLPPAAANFAAPSPTVAPGPSVNQPPAAPRTPPSFSVPPMALPRKREAQPTYQPPAAAQPPAAPPVSAPEPKADPVKPVPQDDLRALRASLVSQAPPAGQAPAPPSWAVRTPAGVTSPAASEPDARTKGKGAKGRKGEKAGKAEAPGKVRRSPLRAAIDLQLIKFLLWACERKYSADDHWTLKDAFEVSTMELRDQFVGAFSQSFAAKRSQGADDDVNDMAVGRSRGRARAKKK